MTTITTTCRRCGREFTPDHRAIVAATWRICPACRPQLSDQIRREVRCRECGRPLAGTRDVCVRCVGVPAL